jgi:hypothetical protein
MSEILYQPLLKSHILKLPSHNTPVESSALQHLPRKPKPVVAKARECPSRRGDTIAGEKCPVAIAAPKKIKDVKEAGKKAEKPYKVFM